MACLEDAHEFLDVVKRSCTHRYRLRAHLVYAAPMRPPIRRDLSGYSGVRGGYQFYSVNTAVIS